MSDSFALEKMARALQWNKEKVEIKTVALTIVGAGRGKAKA